MLSQGGTYPVVNEIRNKIVRERERVRKKLEARSLEWEQVPEA